MFVFIFIIIFIHCLFYIYSFLFNNVIIKRKSFFYNTFFDEFVF